MNDLRNPESALAALQDPATSGGDLDEIAQVHPSMQRRVAAHVNADEALLRYLTVHGDPVAVRIASRRLKQLEPATMYPSLLAEPAVAYPVPAPMPGKSVVKKPRRSLAQALAIGALTVAVAVTGAISVRLHDNSVRGYQPPIPGPAVPFEPDEFPGIPAGPVMFCEVPGGSWILSLCGSGEDTLSSVAISGNGTVFAAGESDSFDGVFEGVDFYATDSDRFMAVVHPENGPWIDRGVSISDLQTAPDGTVVAVGGSTMHETGPRVIKYNHDGSVIWETDFRSVPWLASFNGVAVGPEGAFGTIVAWGLTEVLDEDLDVPRLVMAQFTESGRLVWWHDYGVTLGGTPNGQAVVDANGNIFLVGMYVNPNTEFESSMVSKFSPSGELLWSRSVRGTNVEDVQAATIAQNGNLVAVGVNCSMESDICYGMLLEYDQDGNVVSSWMHEVQRATVFSAIARTPDGGFAIAAHTGDDTPDAVVLKVRGLDAINDSDFLIWQRVFGGTLDDIFEDIAVDSQGNIVVVGTTNTDDGPLPPSHGGWDGVMMRLSPDGEVIPL